MKSDETKWNKRYASGKYPTVPHDAVVNYHSLAQKGDALDIAAGNGRNSCFLAENGFNVDAVDISTKGLDLIKQQNPSINTIHADLDNYRISENSYDLILNINFLDRRLFPQIISGLKKTGLLIFQTFMDPRLTDAYLDPDKIDRYLSPNELLHAFIFLHVLFYEEKKVEFTNGEILKAAILVAKKDFR
jgi:SAM-dependent methyltransferase